MTSLLRFPSLSALLMALMTTSMAQAMDVELRLDAGICPGIDRDKTTEIVRTAGDGSAPDQTSTESGQAGALVEPGCWIRWYFGNSVRHHAWGLTAGASLSYQDPIGTIDSPDGSGGTLERKDDVSLYGVLFSVGPFYRNHIWRLELTPFIGFAAPGTISP